MIPGVLALMAWSWIVRVSSGGVSSDGAAVARHQLVSCDRAEPDGLNRPGATHRQMVEDRSVLRNRSRRRGRTRDRRRQGQTRPLEQQPWQQAEQAQAMTQRVGLMIQLMTRTNGEHRFRGG